MADEASTPEMLALAAAAAAAGVALGKFNGSFANVLNTFVSSSFSLSKAATGGAASLGDMGAAVGQVTSLLGPLGVAFSSVLNTAISTLEKNIATQQTLSNVGATFGGNLSALRDASNKTFLSMEQFGKVVGDSSSILATFGGGVQAGTESFAKTQRILLEKGSETGAMMANLGIGFQEAAEMTSLFMRGQGSMNKNRQMSEAELAQATANYAAELTGLSALTGQSRKVLAEKVAEEMAEAQFQNYLASLDPEEAKKLQAAVTQELAVTGKAGADALKAQAAGFPPMTQASKLFTATQEASVARQQELIAISKDSNIQYEEAQQRFSKSLADSIPGMRGDFDKIRTVLLAGGLQGGTDLTKAVEQIVRTLTATTNKTPAEIKQITDDLVANAKITTTGAAIGADQLKTIIDSSNAALKEMQKSFDSALAAGTKISTTLNDVAGTLASRLPAITRYVESLMTEAGKGIQAMTGKNLSDKGFISMFGQMLDKTGKFVENATNALLGDPAAQEKFFNDLKLGWDGVMTYIKESIPKLGDFLFGSTPGGATTPGAAPPEARQGFLDRLDGSLNSFILRLGNTVFSSAPSAPPSSVVPAGPAPKPKADGGPVNSGQTYLVGENGPELLTAGSSGNVISNDKLTTILSAISDQNGMGESINQLNTTNGQMLEAIQELVRVSQRTLTATRGLNGNLFAA